MQIDGLVDFLGEHPLMRALPFTKGGEVIIKGKVKLCHQYKQYPKVQRFVEIKITFPRQYPHKSPIFEEVGNFLPKKDVFHINPDGSLCLGSPYRVESFLRANSDFNAFFNSFFIPYIYAMSLKIQHNVDFVFGELKHGSEGEIEDLSAIFGLQKKEQILRCLEAMSLKKRLSNKRECPCGCGKRLGVCSFHHIVNKHRKELPRSWFKKARQRLFSIN